MHILLCVMAASAAAAAAVTTPRFVMYYDQWHQTTAKVDKAGVTHVITAFASTTLFTSDPPSPYTPFQDVATIRKLFDDSVKVCLSIGGWGDTAGLSIGQRDDASRKLYAKNIASTLEQHGYDCVDIDWEYPGGNGADYKQNSNPTKADEVDNYPLLLQEIKDAIGDRELGIAVPGLERDMIAFTVEKVPLINDAVDMVNLMTYDLMNRRDNYTTHHTSVYGSLATANRYIELGMDASKLNLGFAFYAKYFKTEGQCDEPNGCRTVLLEDSSGTDTGNSGAVTFLDRPAAMASGRPDHTEGGQWYWEPSTSLFWTWDTPEFIADKFESIVKARGLGGVMAWSLGEDSGDHTYIKAMQAGLETL